MEPEYLTADELLLAEPPREDVPIPELGGKVITLRGLTALEQDAYDESLWEGKPGTPERKFNPVNIRARLVVRCAVNKKGQRLFKDEDATVLGATRTDLVQRLFLVAQRLNGGTAAAVEASKNGSESSPAASGNSDSPSV